MRIKLDENMPFRLVESLAQLGHQTDTVENEGLVGGLDPQVWEAAQRHERFFITQDLHFSDVRQFEPGSHHGLLLLRLHKPGRNALLQRVQSLFQAENVEDWRGCFVVVTDSKIRVRSPKRT